MDKLTAYSVKLKKVVEIKDPKLVTMKNGRMAVTGFAAEDPSIKLLRILIQNNLEKAKKLIG